ncbi:hypothetical protein AB656_06740 [Bifidobacterium actinocoloniiforme DSM 22766]|nr:hypothetical protein AB656_06740 [Bifidobacterium actinocoloniiforme DSM 22766]
MSWDVKRFIRSLLIALATVLILAGLFSAFSTHLPDLSYNAVDYDVTVLPNGDLKIKERIDMKMLSREGNTPWRQLYQRYNINPGNLTGISDISLYDVDQDLNYRQTEPIDPDQVQKKSARSWDLEEANRWYIGQVDGESIKDYQYRQPLNGVDPTGDSCQTGGSSCQVEIGWNIFDLTDADSKVFELTMTMHGVSTAYDDVTAFQWEPIGQINEIPVGKVTGVVHLPKGASGSNSKAWLHYTGPSRNWRGADGSVHFEASQVSPGQYLDLRVTMDRSLTGDVPRTGQGRAGQRIADEEDNQERQWHQRQVLKARLILAAWALAAILVLGLCVLAIRAAFSSFRRTRYSGPILYWRQAPDMSPAAAAALDCTINGDKKKALRSRQMASTVLSLAAKEVISIYPGPVKTYAGMDMLQASERDLAQAASSSVSHLHRSERTSTIVIRPVAYGDTNVLGLSASQQAALAMLKHAGESLNSRVFDLKQMGESYKEDDDGGKLLEAFDDAAAAEFGSLAATTENGINGILEVLGMVAGIGLWALAKMSGQILLGGVCGAVLITVCAFARSYGASTVLSDEGQSWAGRICGLRNYLLDYSSFSDRGVEYLPLWEDYLVYATALGISKEAMRQLALAVPQVTDASWLDNYASGLVYWSYRPYEFGGSWFGEGGVAAVSGLPGFSDFSDLGNQLTGGFSQIQSTISAASGSSGSGGFGGFSGGSGGGSFGGR